MLTNPIKEQSVKNNLNFVLGLFFLILLSGCAGMENQVMEEENQALAEVISEEKITNKQISLAVAGTLFLIIWK